MNLLFNNTKVEWEILYYYAHNEVTIIFEHKLLHLLATANHDINLNPMIR